MTNIKGEVLIALCDALIANGIELPFPQYEIRLKDERTSRRPATATKAQRRGIILWSEAL